MTIDEGLKGSSYRCIKRCNRKQWTTYTKVSGKSNEEKFPSLLQTFLLTKGKK
jgi:hypothetical protein